MSFSKQLLLWYEEHRRDLPWRGINDPYKIWASEIILQQTRVNQGWDYYEKFIDTFPSVSDLANAPIEKVLKVWQGLGYYSRARNMHFTAKQIVEKHNGVFPSDYEQVLKLKGIGDYTAAAITSIAFKLPYPAVDGNVMRVVTRIFGIHDDISTQKTKKTITEKCQALMTGNDPGEFNQAMMEFGALQCTPKSPDCETCPFINFCYAYKNGVIHLLPVKKNTIQIKKRYFHYFVFIHRKQTILYQRKESDIWRELFQFPFYESATETDGYLSELLATYNHSATSDFHTKHQLSHQLIHLSFYIIHTQQLPSLDGTPLIVDIERIHDYPFPIVIARFVENLVNG
ncbi:A/G-specific adenine glycosylase [Bacteroidales bacterium OttesenSCG-928-B11]|nr:A/G-specific adenine glycosylase [Bacteroidales bacterium OttesenSCG-928-C03]MDL2311629.1 A/G-specific adenine glycosylase [Bacteroidales bacterium OttesenSCG-928-B11]MDL2326763.1 A/G-specific adenine glycosylase [Bacteroidales bacterium OttesenSCG-928-A14]